MALLKAREGKGFVERRDRALILTYLDTGARLSEIGNLMLSSDDDAGGDVDPRDGPERSLACSHRPDTSDVRVTATSRTARDMGRSSESF